MAKAPLVAGNVNTVVPATAGASSVTVPLVSPAITTELMLNSQSALVALVIVLIIVLWLEQQVLGEQQLLDY